MNTRTRQFHLGRFKELPIIVFTILVYVLFSVLAVNFNNIGNVTVILQQASINAIVGIGMTIVIMIGGMDLSVGSTLSFCGITAGMLDNKGLPVILTVIITLLVGMALGAINGLIITKLKIPDIIVTLATMNIYRGFAVTMSGSLWINNFSEGFLSIGSTRGGFLSAPIILFLGLAILFGLGLRYLPFGRKLYAVGGNREAASLMGLNVGAIKLKVYILNGMLLAVAGILFASMFGSIQAATAATGLQFQTMGATLIGGASIFGGSGSILGTTFGTLLLGMIKNGLVQISASEYWLDFVTGAIILLALMANLVQFNRRKRS